MNAETFAEINPAKVIIGLVALLGMMGMGLLLSSATGPSEAQLEQMHAHEAQMKAAMERQEMLDQMRYETLPAGYDIGQAMQYGQ